MKHFLILALFVIFINFLYSDWNPGDPSKWEQLPDLSENGYDVDATKDMGLQQPPHILADDFLCTQSGYITEIHFWGSWYHDEIPFWECPEAVEFTISIHADIPAGQVASYSMPGEVLWYTTFSPTYDDVVWYHEGYEGWYDPVTGYSEMNADYYCFQYNFFVPTAEQFYQEGTEENPIVYWLDIQATPLDEEYFPFARFGWKTSETHWNDDAVWVIGEEPFSGLWNELRDPVTMESLDLAFVIVTEETEQTFDFGDAPEGDNAIAYPSLGIMGAFPTCITGGPSGYIQHGIGDENNIWFGQSIDYEFDGNAGNCPSCFPPYDMDECFADGDAGLSITEAYTIDATNNVITCSSSNGTPLGTICATAVWGTDLDIEVHNNSNYEAYVNVLFDWNQNGYWQDDGSTQCFGATTPEYVLVDFPVPPGYSGYLSGLTPPSFVIGPNAGYIWSRFTITDAPVNTPDWDGSGTFDDGETEDYLVKVEEEVQEELDFGDAPDPNYPTLLANNGACHVIDGITYLGSQVDSEADGQQNSDATGDDVLDGNDDEDGVIFTCPLIIGEQGAIIVNASVNGYLNAWIDFDGNGSWADAGEQIFTNLSLSAGYTPLYFSIPSGTTALGNTFARFRFNSTGGLSYYGQAGDGEVEDYMITIEEPIDDGMKMHYHQWPDTTRFGIDVSVTQDYEVTRLIADDFLCSETGPITSIHIWGSWKDDESLDPLFELGIWSDNPAGAGGWSEPDQLLWSKDFVPGEYNASIYYQTVDGEYWYDPCLNTLEFPGDYIVWEYDFTIPDSEAFIQEEGNIYWLSVREFGTENSGWFGWKTSVNHWNDDAVYQCIYPARQWTELIYPSGHPFNPDGEEHISMDMAFYIDCFPTTPEDLSITVDSVSVTLNWSAANCATQYNVYSSTDPYATFPSGWTLETTTTDLFWSEPKSGAGNKKFYRVTAER